MAHRAGLLLTAGLLTLLTACGGGVTEPAGVIDPEQPSPSAREGNISALDHLVHDSFPPPLIDPGDVLRGGPPPDGIPAIDDPKFQKAKNVDWLGDSEPVISLTVNDETRAYPLQVMTWHEIVNDTVGGVPVAVTYCPLCNSGVAFEREAADRVLTFGTSGMLYVDNLVMYDRQTESLWPQLTGQASIGVLTGTQLKAIPMGTVAWSDFSQAFPESLVLTRETGHDRPYGRNPYTGYDNPESGLIFPLPEGVEDDRLAVKERVIGVANGDEATAVVRRSLVGKDPVALNVGGQDLVVWHQPGQSSALDSPEIREGNDIGSVGVFESTLGDRKLTFEAAGKGFRDLETGSRWNLLGQAVSGELKGERLASYEHLDTFWFSWVAFNPETDVVVA